MDIRELGRLDLNLLVALEALLEERNVSRAAERLFVTQSAMSKTLGRLRELFDDPLFIRKGAGMIPTPRAEQLGRHLPQVLQSVQAMIQPMEFDPLSYDGEFDLLVQGHMGVWFLPLLLERLQVSAPNIRLATIAAADDPFTPLAGGELDFVLHAERRSYPPDFSVTTLGYASPVLIAREGHPLAGKSPTWEEIEQYPHVQLIIPELRDIRFEGQEESDFLKREGSVVPRLRTDHLYTAVQVVRQSDCLLPAPPLFMEQDDLAKDLVSVPLPGGEELTIKYVLVTHERILHSAAHEFMRGEIMSLIEEFRARYGLPCLDELLAKRNLPF